MKKKLYLVIDTETASLDGAVYDVGAVLCDKNGHIIERYNSLIECIYNDTRKMKKAFFHRKIPMFYEPLIRCGLIDIKTQAQVKADIQTLIDKADVVAAYNLKFDIGVLRPLDLNFSKVSFLDLWLLAANTLFKQKSFKRVAHEKSWVTEKGNLKTSAEIAFRYGFGKFEFEESHTALDDAIIEAQLLARLLGLKKRVIYGLPRLQPWRIVNNYHRRVVA